MGTSPSLLKIVKSSQYGKQIITGYEIIKSKKLPAALCNPIRDPAVERWFIEEAGRRIAGIPNLKELSPKDRQDLLEMGNRLPPGSVTPLGKEEFMDMKIFLLSPKDVRDRAKQGAELITNNRKSKIYGTVARGIPVGGASSRARSWVVENREAAENLGVNENTPRFLYPLENSTLTQVTLENSMFVGKKLERILPDFIMTQSGVAGVLRISMKEKLRAWEKVWLENMFLFNQIVVERRYVRDQQMIKSELFPAGHGDYPYLLAKYSLTEALREIGIGYFIFSNADEYLWGPDPVMVSIANELFEKGYGMLAIGVENTNNQFGGGFVKEGLIIETPRLPWEIMQQGKPPAAINTTFYICDMDRMAERAEGFREVNKSLVVKDFPGREKGTTEQVLGVDSWAGDIFSSVLAPSAFIWWPRVNFLGIKFGGHLVGQEPIDYLGGRSYEQYTKEAARKYPLIMSALLEGNLDVAKQLHGNGYNYLETDV